MGTNPHATQIDAVRAGSHYLTVDEQLCATGAVVSPYQVHPLVLRNDQVLQRQPGGRCESVVGHSVLGEARLAQVGPAGQTDRGTGSVVQGLSIVAGGRLGRLDDILHRPRARKIRRPREINKVGAAPVELHRGPETEESRLIQNHAVIDAVQACASGIDAVGSGSLVKLVPVQRVGRIDRRLPFRQIGLRRTDKRQQAHEGKQVEQSLNHNDPHTEAFRTLGSDHGRAMPPPSRPACPCCSP